MIKLLIPFFFIFLVSFSEGDQGCSINEHMVMSTLYAQIAGENKALQLQAFNIAEENIKEYLEYNELTGNEAIVLDIDETVLETTPFQAKMIIEHLKFADGFYDYIAKAKCSAIPGAVEFLKFADSLGLNIFYISNRKLNEMNITLKNLQNMGFPNINESNILLKDSTSSKESRRNLVAGKFNILMLIGDNLNDFSEIFTSKTNEERNKTVLASRKEFGKKFIVLPNPSYGDWEGLIYDNNWKLSLRKMDKRRKQVLEVISRELNR